MSGGPGAAASAGDAVPKFTASQLACAPWRTVRFMEYPKRDLGVARSAPDVHFADSVEELSILRLRDRVVHFWDPISLCFSVILRDFGTLSMKKATPRTAKMDLF